MECNQTALAIDYEVVNFDFNNDWINGMLYAPKYTTKVKKKRKRNELSETYCGSKSNKIWGFNTLHILHACAVEIDEVGGAISSKTEDCEKDKNMDCYKLSQSKRVEDGIIVKNNDEYYYRAAQIGNVSTYYFPTGVILLGSLTDNNIEGIPQFFKYLPQTTFQLPPQQAEFDYDIFNIDGEGELKNRSAYKNEPKGFVFLATDKQMVYEKAGEGDSWYNGEKYEVGLGRSGIDWGYGHKEKEARKKGLFLGLTCSKSYTIIKSCINAIRLCELGVEFDEKYEIEGIDGQVDVDGYISKEEIGDGNARSMFATINYNNLSVKRDTYGHFKYDFSIYNDPTSFDNRMVESTGRGRVNNIDKRNLGTIPYDRSKFVDYTKFRYGSDKGAVDYTTPADRMNSFIRYENSFYFYFGLNAGSTAIDLFNEQYFSPCEDESENNIYIGYELMQRDGLFNNIGGKMKIILDNLVLPCDITITSVNNGKEIFKKVGNNEKEIVIDNLLKGDYIVTVIDSNNDIATSKMVMLGPPKITYDVNFMNPSDVDNSDGAITIRNVMAGKLPIDCNYVVRSLNSLTGLITGRISAGQAVTLTELGVGIYEIIVKYPNMTNKDGVLTIVTLGATPRVLTNAKFTVGYSSIACAFKVTSDGGSEIRENGIEYSKYRNMSEPRVVTNSNLNVSNDDKIVGLLDLDDNTTYYFRGYAINDNGVGYGAIIEATTTQQPKIILSTAQAGLIRIRCAITFMDTDLNTSEIGIIYNKHKEPNLKDGDYIAMYKLDNEHDKNEELITEFEVSTSDDIGTEYYIMAYVKSGSTIYTSNIMVETKGGMP